MMCDLFLSWGSSTSANDELALRLFSADFRATGLFPLVERHQPSERLDVKWVKDVFSARAHIGARAKFPSSWRGAVAHVVEREAVARAYDIADGLVWQLSITNAIDERRERGVYQYDRYSLAGIDDAKREWTVVDLHELKLLCDILAGKQKLHSVVDERELYWLADTENGHFAALARIRPGVSGDAISYPNLELVLSAQSSTISPYTIDVYRANIRGHAMGQMRAAAIFAHHGDAAAFFDDDNEFERAPSWGIKQRDR